MRRLLKDSRGNLTLEAAIAFPVFLAFMIFILNFVNLAMVYISMDHAVSEVVKVIATHAYPLGPLQKPMDAANPPPPDPLKIVQDNILSTRPPGEVNTDSLKETGGNNVGELLQAYKGQAVSYGKGLAREASGGIIAGYVKNHLDDYYALDNLNGMVKVDKVDADIFGGNVNGVALGIKDVGVMVSYSVKVLVPFSPVKEIKLYNTAVERAWVDDPE